MYRNDYEKWLAGGCSCETPSPCINGYDECSCDNILLEISNLHTDDRTLSAKIETKQDILEAGDGIKIENNVIEATYKPMDVDSELSLTSTNPLQNKAVTEALNNVWTAIPEDADLTNYYTKSESDNKYQEKGNYALKSDIPNVSNFLTKTTADNTYQKKGDYALKSELFSGNYNDLSNKPTIPTVPTNVSAFNNDAGYLTSHQSLKTVNGQSLVGEGNIVIEGGSEAMDVDSELSLTSTNPLQNKAVTEALNGKLDATAYTPVDLSSYALKSELPTVPTNVSAFNNDAGYLTEHQDISNLISNASYNSTNKRIEFSNTDNTVIASVNARDFIKDGMVDNVQISNSNLVISFNTDSGKEAISIPLTDIFNPNNYYTKSESDGKYQPKGDYALKSELPTDYYSKTEVDTKLNAKQDTLVSGTNIKTINGSSLLGSGNIEIQGGNEYTAGRAISISGDVISLDLPISAGTYSYSIQEGFGTNASALYSHAEGLFTTASGWQSHAEGNATSGTNTSSHAEGDNTLASGKASHAEGYSTKARGDYSHSEGHTTTASGLYSHSTGYFTTAKNSSEFAAGKLNISRDEGKNSFSGESGCTLFTVGNGLYTGATIHYHNAFEIRETGDIYISDVNDETVDGYYDKPMVRLQDKLFNKTEYYNKTEVDNSISTEINSVKTEINTTINNLIWCGTQTEYNALPTKNNNTLYLIHS